MLILSIANAYGQEGCHYNLNGFIVDVDTKEPLPFVQIKIKGLDKTTSTEIDGSFKFENLCDSNNVLIIKCFGYCDTICENFHKHLKTPTIHIKQEVITLGEVTITIDQDDNYDNPTVSEEEINKEQLQKNPTQSLASTVAEIEGVTLTSTGANVQLPVIHGLYGNRILVLNNGLKHGFQNWGTDHAPEIDINSANKIKVVKGAAGVRYGPEALGGALIIESDPMHLNEHLNARLSSGYQTNGRGYYFNTGFGQGLKHFSYNCSATYTKIGDRKAPSYMLTNSGKEETAVSGGLRYNKGQFDFNVYYSFVDQNLGIYRTAIAESGASLIRALSSDTPLFERPFSYEINEPNQLTKHHLAKGEIEWFYSEEGSLRLRVGSQLNKRKEYDVRRDAYLPIIDLNLTTNDYQLDWNHPKYGQFEGKTGLQGFSQNNDNNPGTGTTPFIPNYNTTRYSGFIIERLKKEKTTYELGARLDYEYNNIRGRQTNQDIFRDEYSFTNLTASIGLFKNITDNTTIRVNIGTAWRTPNMAELYSFGQHSYKVSYGLLRYYTNPEGNVKTNRVIKMNNSEVNPEKGIKWINEFKTHKKENIYTLTAYAHYIQNYIYDRPITVTGTVRGPMPAFIYVQSDAVFLGTDFTWQRNWSKTLQGTFGFSYLWSKNVEKNEPLINQPPITTNYKLAFQTKKFLKLKSSKLFAKGSYTFRQYNAPITITPQAIIDGSEEITPTSEIFDFRDAPEGYFLLELGWQFKWKRLGGSISVQNVLNTEYRNYLNEMRYFTDEMGRNILFTLNYVIKNK